MSATISRPASPDNVPNVQGTATPSKSWLSSLLRGWQEWISLALLFVLLAIAVGSIERARWISPQPAMTTVLGLSIVAAFLFAKVRLPSAAAHFLAIVAGAGVTLWQCAGLMPPGEFTARLGSLAGALTTWWAAAAGGNPAEGTIQFALFLAAFPWFIGYFSAWSVLKGRNPWTGFALGAVALIVNLSNLTDLYYLSFLLYLFTAGVFIAQVSLSKRYYIYRRRDHPFPLKGVIYAAILVIVAVVMMVPVAWLAPQVEARQPGETSVATRLPFWDGTEAFFMNFLARVTSQKPHLSASGQKALYFGDPSDRSETVHFTIQTKQPLYWRSRMYDLYTSRGWRSSNTIEVPEGKPGATVPDQFAKRVQVTQTVIPAIKTDVLLNAGEFVSADVSYTLHTLSPLTFEVNLLSAYRDNTLPPDVADLARTLRLARTSDRTFTLRDIQRRLPGDLSLRSIGESRLSPTDTNFQNATVNRRLAVLEVTRRFSGPGDTVAAVANKPMNPDQPYTVTGSITSASPTDLIAAGQKYPSLVLDYYLQLPSTLPDSIRQTAKTVTANATTPYEKVVAIKDYLSRLTYNASVGPMPEGVDGVEYFLFTLGQGDCFYFASAEAVMLRAVGVPARLVAGYLPGEWDGKNGISTLRAKDYHAWVDVYFPTYGWVEFDPTPSTGTTNVTFSGDLVTAEEYVPEESLLGTGEEIPPFDAGSPSVVSTSTSVGLGFLIPLAAALILLLWWRRFARMDYASGVYARMCALATLARTGPKASQTPMEYCAGLSGRLPAQADAINSICQAYVQSRFSPDKTLAPDRRLEIQRAIGRVQRGLLRRLFSER